jgi:hypothetical protein
MQIEKETVISDFKKITTRKINEFTAAFFCAMDM